MKKILKPILGSTLGATIITLIVMTVSFIIMLFSSKEDGMRQTFFNTVFFNSSTKADGTITMNFGLTGNFVPILISVVGITLFIFATYVVYEKLMAYRQKLIEHG